jgi:hypothetical protein
MHSPSGAGIKEGYSSTHEELAKGGGCGSPIPHMPDFPAGTRGIIYDALFSSLLYSLLLEKCTASVNSAFGSMCACS